MPTAARAFPNSLPMPPSDSKPLPRKPGPAPTDIGIVQGVEKPGVGMLKPCLDTKPHCFSSTLIMEFDEFLYDAGVGDPGYLAPWKFSGSKSDAMQDVLRAVKDYPPGQSDIDGGGWSIIKQEPNYVYVQYESLRKGFIDE